MLLWCLELGVWNLELSVRPSLRLSLRAGSRGDRARRLQCSEKIILVFQAALLPILREQAGLRSEHGARAIIPGNVIGPANLFRERHLGTDHLFGGRAVELSASNQPFELDARRAGHADRRPMTDSG